MPSSKIRICIRTRPTANFASDIIELLPDKKTINIHIPKSDSFINNQLENWSFKFDQLQHNASQETVYEDCAEPIVKGLFDGYNGTIFCYGQTGAGKTFTMTGATENYKHRGIIPRALSRIFKGIADRPQMATTVKISYLEIYNEQMIDLLKPNFDGSESMTVIEDKNGSSYVRGLSTEICNSEEEALNLLFEGETNRSIGDHQLNKTSSRSHCILTVYMESRSRDESSERVIYSKLNLVDLAGSERLSKTNSSGTTLKEAMYINKSLTFLEQVILALADKKRDHIPYRQSKLTNVLRDALGGNSNTVMIGNIWAEKSHIEETVSTLRFATRMQCVYNAPIVNVQYDPMALIKKYEREIKELKQELAMHDTLQNRSHIQYEPFSEGQRYEIQKKVKLFVNNQLNELEIINLRQIKETFDQFRIFYKQLETERNDLSTQLAQLPPPVPANHGRRNSTLGIPSNATNDRAPLSPSNSKPTLEADDGVGETDGAGFGIGLAPQVVRPTPLGRRSSFVEGSKQMPTPTRQGKEKDDQRKKDSNKTQEKKDDKKAPNPSAPKDTKQLVVSVTNVSGKDSSDEQKIIGGDQASIPTVEETSATGDVTVALSDSPSVALGGIEQPYSVGANALTKPPNKSDEFEVYKKGPGSEIIKTLQENKAALKAKKAQAKEFTDQLNKVKAEIEEIKLKLGEMKSGQEYDDPSSTEASFNVGDSSITSSEEQNLLSALKSLKSNYRNIYSSLKSLKSEIEYSSHVIDSSRQKLISEFDTWYEKLYGHLDKVTVLNIEAGNENDDLMDIGEKFDKLQMEKLKTEDPDSYAFYNALKKNKRKGMTTFAGAGKKGKASKSSRIGI
ncbi:P-loop containing nucleoside triphosphate hydrolase protein [Paraphysoderma sedebokerense]|nr:P-loop containing nucleoside triphosphate hydrolase protein [Paraphysoderma sedebokerense]